MKATLVLEDGSLFEGVSIEGSGERIGQVVLNTAVVGYQEIMTDPSNAGKILVLTYPLIGNYGIAKKFYESKRCWLAGLVIKEASRISSNWQSEMSFVDFLKKEGVLSIVDVDTRTLATAIRDKGEMFGIISTETSNKPALLAKIKEFRDKGEPRHIKDISVKKPTEIGSFPSGPKIAVLDMGMLQSFTKQLNNLGCSVTLLPYDTDAKAILAMRPDGLIISNGPEEDEAIHRITDTVRALLGKVPMLGISSGHEILGLALGVDRKKMAVGHHGVNYPIKSATSYKGEITVQNHSYVLNNGALRSRKNVSVTMRNVNDNTIEEMESKSMKLLSTQYYPASPGFDEPSGTFLKFMKMLPVRKRSKTTTTKSTPQEAAHAKA
ncbi:MAG: glutamine-hydrolyzing carbamoyl-phosphate synthase small subunit [Candidatus Omnitrophica bacterium]|nr:glutamine-hydrolyzing carbamoyl-phosphate synthase small subunit [Candidatus Omnitrophota bacterium]